MQPHSPFSLAFQEAEAELGRRIGYPALVYDAQSVSLPSAPSTVEGLQAQLDDARALIDTLHSANTEAHALLWHYDLVRQPNGVEWGPVEMLKTEQIDQLWSAITAARAWLEGH